MHALSVQTLICLTMDDLPMLLYELSQGGHCIGYLRYETVGARLAMFFFRS